MEKRGALTTGLAIAGVVLVWLAPAAGVVLPLFAFGRGDRLTALWYIPAAMLPTVLVGGALLVWSAMRARLGKRAVAGSFAASMGLWIAAVVLSLVTGLSSGTVQEGGWQSALVTACFAGYTIASVVLGLSGARLLMGLRSEGQRVDARGGGSISE